MKLIAVSLIGIPASGKTTLAHKIFEMSTMNSLNAGVIIISFDIYININFSEITEGEYKLQRETLISKTKDLMKLLTENEQHRWSEILTSHELKVHYHNIKLNYPTLVLLDDNMYYRSMRQRVRAICKSLQCQHFQIFFKSSLQEARERNQQRSTQVPDSIIVKMIDLLEPPTNPRTIIINSSLIDDATVLAMLEDRISNPEAVEVSQPKISQHQSMIHEMDLITRKVLGMRIERLTTKDNITKHCETLNRKRKEFLEDLRSQNLDAADLESLRAAFNCYLDE